MASVEYDRFYQELMTHGLMPKNISLQKMREFFETTMDQYPPPENIEFHPFSIGSLSACWVSKQGVLRKPTILYFHGGGYVLGSLKSYRGLMGRIAESTGCSLLGFDYRLAPENPYPAALEDAVAAYSWLLSQRIPPNQIIVAGDSCGAGLILSFLLHLKLEKIESPAAGICICPWVDLSQNNYTKTEDYLDIDTIYLAAKSYAGSHNLKDPSISPLYGNLEDFPPLFIQTGTRELLHDQIIQFAEKAKTNGVKVNLEKWPEMIHNWHFFAPQFPEAQEAIDHIGMFVKQVFQ